MTASKRIFCFVICAAILALSVICVSADETSTALTQGEFSYEVLDDGTIGITEYHGEGGDVVVPAEIDSKVVTALGDELFWSMSNVTSVSLPDTLEFIGARVFQSCTALTEIFLPDSVAEIGDACFHGCTALAQINVPANLVYVGAFAFDNTAWVTQFDGCTSIILGSRVFYKYLADEDAVVIPDGVVCVSDNAFEGKKLSFVFIPDSVAFIGDFCFYDCTNLKEIKLPSDIYYLGEYSVGFLAGASEVKKTEGFVIYSDSDSVGSEYAVKSGFTLKTVEEYSEPSTLPEEEICNPTAQIRPAEITTQQTEFGLSQGAVIAIVLSIGGCVVIIGGIAVVSHFYEKKRKKINKDSQKQNSKKKKK